MREAGNKMKCVNRMSPPMWLAHIRGSKNGREKTKLPLGHPEGNILGSREF